MEDQELMMSNWIKVLKLKNRWSDWDLDENQSSKWFLQK